jgi:regulator of PEP synthase PpsR (kinase-PPPase family)
MSAPPIYVVSGGLGASGEQLARTALAQFQDADVPIVVVPHVRDVPDIQSAVNQAAACNGTIVHTLVDARLRQAMIDIARDHNVAAIDLIGHLLSRLTSVLEREPAGTPGLYRQLREAYFQRIEAIEFAVAHDDGRNPQDLRLADIVLAGVSRVGKTPLAMYLSVLGWKVANVPLVGGIDPPTELLAADRRRVVGLTIKLEQLLNHRVRRQARMGIARNAPYSRPDTMADELETTLRFFRRNGFAVVDTTDKPIEESADEVIAAVSRRLSNPETTKDTG